MASDFPKQRRVTKSGDFTRILRRGACAADGILVLFAVPGDDGQTTRLGVTIPKRTGNAVKRNLWKRLIRESFRTQLHAIPCGYDLIVRPKKGASPNWIEIQRSVPKLARKAVHRLS